MYAKDNLDFQTLKKALTTSNPIFITRTSNDSSDPKCVTFSYFRKPLTQMMKSRRSTNVHMNIAINNTAPSLVSPFISEHM